MLAAACFCIHSKSSSSRSGENKSKIITFWSQYSSQLAPPGTWKGHRLWHLWSVTVSLFAVVSEVEAVCYVNMAVSVCKCIYWWLHHVTAFYHILEQLSQHKKQELSQFLKGVCLAKRTAAARGYFPKLEHWFCCLYLAWGKSKVWSLNGLMRRLYWCASLQGCWRRPCCALMSVPSWKGSY